MFTARFALSPYIKQTRFVLKGLISGQFMWIVVTTGQVFSPNTSVLPCQSHSTNTPPALYNLRN
jgi:hypothetical protein